MYVQFIQGIGNIVKDIKYVGIITEHIELPIGYNFPCTSPIYNCGIKIIHTI